MFRFKQFEIDDTLSAMKIGTDGVLLGAWADVVDAGRILDVGTGTGLVAIMCAQRSATVRVHGIDIVADAVAEARHNMMRTVWRDRLSAEHADLRGYGPDVRYDHVVSNPPFFLTTLHSPDAARAMARHADTLTYDDLVTAAERLLTPGGRLSVVLPTECASTFRRVAFERLWLSRITDVVTREGEPPKRTLMEFRLTDKPLMPRAEVLTIQAKDGSYTEEYWALTKEFYLNF
jgi:tRNA1Val (adenine37-N6)-methyltransferase